MARILLVEDDPGLSSMMLDFFRTSGFNAAAVPDGARALQYVDARRPDVIVLDLMLPVINGVEVAKRLRQAPDTCDIPILAITAVDGPSDFADILMVDAVLPKPFDLERVDEEIRALLDGQADDGANGSALLDPEISAY